MRAFAIFSICACLGSRAWAQGPIETRNHRSTSLLFLRFDPRGRLLRAGQSELSGALIISNDLRKLPNASAPALVEDQETARLSVRYRQGFAWGEFEVEVPLLSRGGGILDPVMEWWHEHIIGVTNLRSQTPYGRSEVILPGSGRFGSAAGLGDITTQFSRSLTPAVDLSIGLKFPTGDASRLLGSGAVDEGINLSYRHRVSSRLAISSQVGWVGQGRATRVANSRSDVHQESLSFVMTPNTRDAWTLQWQGEASALVTGLPVSDETHRMLSFGYSRKLNSRDHVQVFFSEDGDFLNYRVPELVNIAPDFTLGLRWTRRF